MTYDQLLDFVENYMPRRIQHIYLPLLIGKLVDADGSATLRQLAESVLAQDESQVQYYERRLQEMPLKVLNKHSIIKRKGNLVSLNTKKLTFDQKSQIKMLCEKALREFIVKKGLGIWDYRLLDTDPIPDSLRYRVLKESGGRCSLCGATKKERPLDVDHIKPKSKGGKNVYENLQALCSKCNRSKGNKDDTDFRDDLIESVDDCLFCYHNVKDRIVDEYETVFAIKDGFPVSENHLLIIPKRHTADYFTMSEKERRDADRLIEISRKRISEQDLTVTGFNIGVNSGESAGQTIFHCHIHLIPRRDGDTPSPRGGVRGAIPDKMGYPPKEDVNSYSSSNFRSITINNLWASRDQNLWKAALNRYWDFVKPTHYEIEQELNKFELQSFKEMNSAQWYDFLLNKYFVWKFTAPNRYKTTTFQLKRYQGKEDSIDNLFNIKKDLLNLDVEDISEGLKVAMKIRGLGTAGASGLLSILYPSYFGTVDQFIVEALREIEHLPEKQKLVGMKKQNLTRKNGVILINIMKSKAIELNNYFNSSFWSPRKIDMILWATRK